MTELKIISNESADLFHSFVRDYMKEITVFHPVPQGLSREDVCRYFDSYFQQNGKIAYYLMADEQPVGFALIRLRSGQSEGHTISEFFVSTEYRGCHLAAMSAKLIFSLYPGLWEIKYNENNLPAARLWISVSSEYAPELCKDGDLCILRFTVP